MQRRSHGVRIRRCRQHLKGARCLHNFFVGLHFAFRVSEHLGLLLYKRENE